MRPRIEVAGADETPCRTGNDKGSLPVVGIFAAAVGAGVVAWLLFASANTDLASSPFPGTGFQPGGDISVLVDRPMDNVSISLEEGGGKSEPISGDPIERAIAPASVDQAVTIRFRLPALRAVAPKTVPIRVVFEAQAQMASLNSQPVVVPQLRQQLVQAWRSNARVRMACGRKRALTDREITTDNSAVVVLARAQRLPSGVYYALVSGRRYSTFAIKRGRQTFVAMPVLNGWVGAGEASCFDVWMTDSVSAKRWHVPRGARLSIDAGVATPSQSIAYATPDTTSSTELRWTGPNLSSAPREASSPTLRRRLGSRTGCFLPASRRDSLRRWPSKLSVP